MSKIYLPIKVTGNHTPTRAHQHDAGLDLYVNWRWEEVEGLVTYYTGVRIAIPEGYVGLLFPRSSVTKKDLRLANSVGVIDSGYRGEILLKFDKTAGEHQDAKLYENGERCGQLVIVPIPTVELVFTEDLDKTDRDLGGFGSTGD